MSTYPTTWNSIIHTFLQDEYEHPRDHTRLSDFYRLVRIFQRQNPGLSIYLEKEFRSRHGSYIGFHQITPDTVWSTKLLDIMRIRTACIAPVRLQWPASEWKQQAQIVWRNPRFHDSATAIASAFRKHYVVVPSNADDLRFAMDPVSSGLIPRRRGIVLNRQPYNARGLQTWLAGGGSIVPHSRRALTPEEMADIGAKAVR